MDDASTHLEVGAVLEVAGGDADDALSLAQEAGHLDPRGEVGAVLGGGARGGRHQPGVVDLAVVVADRSGDRLGLEVGRDPGDLAAEEVAVLGHAHVVLAGHRHAVVQHQTGTDIGALPEPVRQRVEERHRSDEVRREPGEQEPALLQGLTDETEVEHLEVAQPPVDELGRARRRAAGEVALLQQARVEAAGDSVQGDARADDAATDDEDVELALALEAGHRGDRLVAGLGAERAVVHAAQSCKGV